MMDPDIRNANTGISWPYGNASPIPGMSESVFRVEGGVLKNRINVWQRTPAGALPAEEIIPHTAILKGVRSVVPVGGADIFKEFLALANGNLTQVQRVVVEDYQGTIGDNFEVFSQAQAPDFVIPASGYSNGSGGLTNAAAWAQKHIAIAGAVAPCASTRPGVLAFTCGVTTPTPRQAPSPFSAPPLSAPTGVRIQRETR
jgi:hypothetical protein